MGFQRMINAACDVDDCLEISEASGWTVAEAWDYAKDAGWHKTQKGRVICPMHWEEGKR